MEKIFTDIYRTEKWGRTSGEGSTVEFNKQYFDFMSNFIKEKKITSVVDLGCGSFVVSGEFFLNSDVHYTGIDCVGFIINLLKRAYQEHKNLNFLHYDVFSKKEDLPSADLFLLKDVLQHWTTKCIYEFLDYMVLKHKNSIFIIINSCKQMYDSQDIKENGEWRQLSSDFFPLKKYKPEVVFKYHDKEVSLIRCV